jgi:hypothetical protein
MTPPVVAIPRLMLAKKPAYGSPCTRCGACCVATLCDLGRAVLGDRPGPCPALLVDKQTGLAACGLVEYAADERHRQAAELLIYAGGGCDARFGGEPVNYAFRARIAAEEQQRGGEIAAAKRLWGVNADD